mgnify:CR=1 FL=1
MHLRLKKVYNIYTVFVELKRRGRDAASWGIIFAFGLYFLALFGIGIFHMKKEQDLAGYVLGGRKVGPWVSAMSAEASDMSGWMLMGLPGYAYVAGVSAFWIAIGFAIGTRLNWLVLG